MKSIKKFFIKRALKTKDRSKVMSLKPAHQWKILYDSTTEEQIGKLSYQLQRVFNCHKDDIVKFGVSEESSDPSIVGYDCFNKLGVLDEEVINGPLLAPCEYLIIYTKDAGLLIRFLAGKIRSKLQIGLSNNEPGNDLTINVSARETSIFVEELKNYLAKIKFKHEAV